MKLLVALCVPLVAAAAAAATVEPPQPSKLQVGVFERPPFASKNQQGEWEGLALDLWDQIALQNGYLYEYIELKEEDAAAAVADGRVDVLAGLLPLNAEQAAQLDFTFGYLGVSLGLAIRKGEWIPDWTAIFRRIFNVTFFRLGAIVFMLTVLVSFAIWMLEYLLLRRMGKAAEQLRFGDFLWFSIATLTTVGSGPGIPKSITGRLIGILWMVASVLLVTAFTASVASSVGAARAAHELQRKDALRKMLVGVVQGGAAEARLETAGLRTVSYPDMDAALQALEEGLVDGVVGDMLRLQHLVELRRLENVELRPLDMTHMHLAFALPPQSELTRPVNTALLRTIESEEWLQTVIYWLGGDQRIYILD